LKWRNGPIVKVISFRAAFVYMNKFC